VAGAVYLGGGGSSSAEANVWDAMLRDSPRVLYWPFALPAERVPPAEAWLRAQLAGRVPHHQQQTWISLAGRDPPDLNAFDLLFVGGGNTFRLLDHVRRHGFIDPVRAFVVAGGSYYGGSAGAVLATDSIRIADGHDPNEPGLADVGSLGLVHGLDVLPHYTPDQHHSTRQWARRHGATVLGVPEASGLISDNGHIRVLGPEPVYIIDANSVRAAAAGTGLASRGSIVTTTN